MIDPPYPCNLRSSPFFPFLSARICMVLQVLVFLLVVCPLLSGAALASRLAPSPTLLLTRRSQAQHTPPSAQARCPDDCPACRLASPAASSGGPVAASVRALRQGENPAGGPQPV